MLRAAESAAARARPAPASSRGRRSWPDTSGRSRPGSDDEGGEGGDGGGGRKSVSTQQLTERACSIPPHLACEVADCRVGLPPPIIYHSLTWPAR